MLADGAQVKCGAQCERLFDVVLVRFPRRVENVVSVQISSVGKCPTK